MLVQKTFISGRHGGIGKRMLCLIIVFSSRQGGNTTQCLAYSYLPTCVHIQLCSCVIHDGLDLHEDSDHCIECKVDRFCKVSWKNTDQT